MTSSEHRRDIYFTGGCHCQPNYRIHRRPLLNVNPTNSAYGTANMNVFIFKDLLRTMSFATKYQNKKKKSYIGLEREPLSC